jgi:methylated-DNA-[protein]-cysteine S-methyltransferase
MTTHTSTDSPIGELTLVADEGKLTGVYFSHHWYAPDQSTFGPRSDAGFEEVTSSSSRARNSLTIGEVLDLL